MKMEIKDEMDLHKIIENENDDFGIEITLGEILEPKSMIKYLGAHVKKISMEVKAMGKKYSEMSGCEKNLLRKRSFLTKKMLTIIEKESLASKSGGNV